MRIIKIAKDKYRKANLIEELDEFFDLHKNEIFGFSLFTVIASLFCIGWFIFDCIKYGL